jgi:hypothetical protein
MVRLGKQAKPMRQSPMNHGAVVVLPGSLLSNIYTMLSLFAHQYHHHPHLHMSNGSWRDQHRDL